MLLGVFLKDYTEAIVLNVKGSEFQIRKKTKKARSPLGLRRVLGIMDPFHKTVITRLTVISIVNPQKFLIFVFFF